MQRQSATTLLALLVGCAVIPATHAYSVNVVSSQPVTRQIMPELATIQGIMEEMVRMQTATGTAITQNSEKLATVIAQDGQATRQQMIFSNETHRLEEARKSFSVPDSICSESASGIAAESRRAAASAAARLSQGEGSAVNPSGNVSPGLRTPRSARRMIVPASTPVTARKRSMPALAELMSALTWAICRAETARYDRSIRAQAQQIPRPLSPGIRNRLMPRRLI